MLFYSRITTLCLTLVLVMPATVFAATTPAARFSDRVPREVRDVRVTPSTAYRTDQVLVKFVGDEQARPVRLGAGESVADALARFSTSANVTFVEPDYVAHAFMVPNDPYYPYQWHMDNATNDGIEMEQAWNITNGSGAVVAVIDTGIAYEDYSSSSGGWWRRTTNYYQAPDLAGTSFVPGYDFVNDDTHPNDDNGHGTHVAGTIAQRTNNGDGVAGVAYGASIMPLKVLNASGSGSYSDIADAIRFAADNGADVINLSLGGPSGSQTLADALAYAYNRGVTIVAAAGNDGQGSVSYPAAYDDYVIAVGATRFDETRAPYSNYGSALDLVAPGGDMNVDQNGDGYGDGVLQQTFSNQTNNFGYYFFQGTSMASPHVAGVAALVIASGAAETPADVRAALEGTADDLGTAGRDHTYGHGLVNAAAALGYTPTPLEPNEAPVADDLSVNTSEDTPAVVTLTATDADNDPISYEIVSSPSHGTLSGVAPNVTYTPSANYHGSDSFSFRASDGIENSNTATVSITVYPVNDTPTVSNIPNVSFVTGSSNSSIDLDGYVSDPDNSDAELEWTVTGDSDVSVSIGSSNVVTFTTSSGWTGSETVTFTATDPGGLSDSDSVTVTVTEVAAVPTATLSIELTTSGWRFWRADANVTVMVNGAPLTGAVVRGEWGGVLSGTDGSTTDSSGVASFRSDRSRSSGSVTFTVTAVEKDGISYDLTGETNDSTAGGTSSWW